MKYRKKPVVVDAVQFTEDNYQECRDFCSALNVYQHPKTLKQVGTILTLEGLMEVMEGDFIIKGVKGEFYPCKEDIFRMTYEEFFG